MYAKVPSWISSNALAARGAQCASLIPMSIWPILSGPTEDYLMRVLPHIAELLVPKISDAIDWADTIVVTSADPVYEAAIDKLGSDKVVLDFAQFYRQGPGNLPGDNARMAANGSKRTVAAANLMSA